MYCLDMSLHIIFRDRAVKPALSNLTYYPKLQIVHNHIKTCLNTMNYSDVDDRKAKVRYIILQYLSSVFFI